MRGNTLNIELIFMKINSYKYLPSSFALLPKAVPKIFKLGKYLNIFIIANDLIILVILLMLPIDLTVASRITKR